MKRFARSTALAFLACACAGVVGVPAAALAPQISHHDLAVAVDPDTHWLAVTDVLHVTWDPGAGRPLNFLLSDALKVEQVELEDGAALDWSVSAALRGRQQVTVLLPPEAARQLRLRVSYRGSIAHEVREADDLSFVVGDRTEGIIDADGVYLSGDTGWTPAGPDDLATYRVAVTLPAGWEVCTQGRLLNTVTENDKVRTDWLSEVPSDGLALVAGRYTVERRTYGDVAIATYLFPDHAAASQMLADGAAEHIAHFSSLLGPYPFPQFAIVENFFSSGYAFPGFTLIGSGVLARPERMLHPGYLDHEISHNWWGNGVFVDQREGNWSEALATYYANYLSHEREGVEAARTYRTRAMLRYAIHAPAGEDYPLALFGSKSTKLDDAVGYTKGSMFLHLLRKTVGDDVFWPTMREVAQAHIGTRIGWSTFVSALSRRSGRPLDLWAAQWLHRTGAPQLALENVKVSSDGGGYRVEGEIVQTGEPYTLPVPVRVETADNAVDATVDVQGARTRFSVRSAAIPLRVFVDPEADVFRRLPPDAQTPCLNRTLYAGGLLCTYPEDPRDPRNARYRDLAVRAADDRGGLAVPASEVTAQLIEDRSVLVFGHAEGNPRLESLLHQAADVVTVDALGFSLRGERHTAPGSAVLASIVRTDAPDRTVTVYAGNAPQALERADLVFFYGWDSVVRFEGGRPVDRFDLAASSAAVTWNGLVAMGGRPDPAALERDVRTLADPWVLGRMTGQPESQQVQDFLLRRFQELGLSPAGSFAQEFRFPDPRAIVPEPALTLTYRRDRLQLPVWPVWWSAPKAAQSEVMFAGYGWDDATWDDYGRYSADGGIVTVFGGGPPRSGVDDLGALRQQALTAQKRGASGLLVVVPRGELDRYIPAIALPYAGLPWPAARSPRGGADANALKPSLALRAARYRSRTEAPDEAVRIPVWVMPWDDPNAPDVGPLPLDRWRRRLQGGRTATDARVRGVRITVPQLWAPGERTGVNVLGLIEGTDPVLKNAVIVVGAHYDHLGLAQTGEVFRGADDNASGVAAMLATAAHLASRRDALLRTVCFVAFDAEEWGLYGSRAFLDANLLAPKKIVAMLNADSIGRNVDGTVYLVGRSTYPKLGEGAERWAEAVGLQLGRDIDKFAYAHGSDHWPFSEHGIPALTIFASDYATMDTARDVPDALDYAHAARVTQLLSAFTYELATQGASAEQASPPATLAGGRGVAPFTQ